jgi:hypothetical protein
MTNFRIPPFDITVLGVSFQAFIDPTTDQAVFSQRGAADGLKIPESSLRKILLSESFKSLRGSTSPCAKLSTEVSSKPISVVTQSDLVILVKLAAEKGYPVAASMQDASFAILLQQSVDEVLGVERSRTEYLEGGATLRQQLEYRYSYGALQDSTFNKKHGVRGLCKINLQVSNLAVENSDELRRKSKNWRHTCSGSGKVRLTIGNTVHQRAVESSSAATFSQNLKTAAERTAQIFQLIDAPF